MSPWRCVGEKNLSVCWTERKREEGKMSGWKFFPLKHLFISAPPTFTFALFSFIIIIIASCVLTSLFVLCPARKLVVDFLVVQNALTHSRVVTGSSKETAFAFFSEIPFTFLCAAHFWSDLFPKNKDEETIE